MIASLGDHVFHTGVCATGVSERLRAERALCAAASLRRLSGRGRARRGLAGLRLGALFFRGGLSRQSTGLQRLRARGARLALEHELNAAHVLFNKHTSTNLTELPIPAL